MVVYKEALGRPASRHIFKATLHFFLRSFTQPTYPTLKTNLTMRSAILTLVATAIGALAQADHAVSGFVYLGCVRAPLSGTTFSSSPSVFPLDPEDCQRACPEDTTVVAVGLGRCHCIHPGGQQAASRFDFERVSEDSCDVSCGDDDAAPWCGGGMEVNGVGVEVVPYNVYLASGWGLARRTPTPVARVPTPAPTPQRNSTEDGGGGGGGSGDRSSGSGDKGSSDSGSGSGDGSDGGSGSNNDAVISAGFKRLSGSFAAVMGGSLVVGLIVLGF